MGKRKTVKSTAVKAVKATQVANAVKSTSNEVAPETLNVESISKGKLIVEMELPSKDIVDSVIKNLSTSKILKQKTYRKVDKGFLAAEFIDNEHVVGKELADAWTSDSFSTTITFSTAIHKLILENKDTIAKKYPFINELVELKNKKLSKSKTKAEIEKLRNMVDYIKSKIPSAEGAMKTILEDDLKQMQAQITSLELSSVPSDEKAEYTISTPKVLEFLLRMFSMQFPRLLDESKAVELANVGKLKNKLESVSKRLIVCLNPQTVKSVAEFNGLSIQNFTKLIVDSINANGGKASIKLNNSRAKNTPILKVKYVMPKQNTKK